MTRGNAKPPRHVFPLAAKIIIWRLNKTHSFSMPDLQSVINECSNIPILLIVESFHKSYLAQCIRMGVSDYIVSPALPEEILLKVQRIQIQGKASDAPVSHHDIRDVTVQLVRNSIAMWQKYSNKSKIELAESSKLWRVYLDGSTAKTRTLDEYLSLQTLPKNPRWETVIRTVNFVLEECNLDEQDAQMLGQQLKVFNQLLAV